MLSRYIRNINGGSVYVSLERDSGESTKRSVRVLVLSSFTDEPDDRSHVVCYKSPDPQNCQLSNLYWGVTPESEFTLHPHGERSGSAKLTEVEVLEIRSLYHDGASITYKALADSHNVAESTIADIIKMRTWKRLDWEAAKD